MSLGQKGFLQALWRGAGSLPHGSLAIANKARQHRGQI